jgi:hypothetical protein
MNRPGGQTGGVHRFWESEVILLLKSWSQTMNYEDGNHYLFRKVSSESNAASSLGGEKMTLSV